MTVPRWRVNDMPSKPLRSLCVVAALLVTAGAAAGQGRDGVGADHAPLGSAPVLGCADALAGNMWMTLYPIDIDGDGSISTSEVSRHAQLVFVLFDRDGDRALTMDEYLQIAMDGDPPADVCLAPPFAQPGPDDQQ